MKVRILHKLLRPGAVCLGTPEKANHRLGPNASSKQCVGGLYARLYSGQ